MELPFSGELARDEYFLSLKMVQCDAINNKKRAIEPRIVALVVAGWLFVLGINFVFYQKIVQGAVASAVGVVFILFWYLLQQAYQRMWKPYEGVTVSGTISSDGIDLNAAGKNKYFSWVDFSGYGEDEDLMVLYFAESDPGIAFPRHFFKSRDDWHAFKSMVKEKLSLIHQLDYVYDKMRKFKAVFWFLIFAVMITCFFAGFYDAVHIR